MATYRRFSNKFKEQVVKEYLSGSRFSVILAKYDLGQTQLLSWTKQYRETGSFQDGRATGGGRPKKIDMTQMTKDEYIKYLEMENDILKQLSSLGSKKQK